MKALIKKLTILAIIFGWGGFIFYQYWHNHPGFVSGLISLLDILKPLGFLFLFLLFSYLAGFVLFRPFNLQLTQIEAILFRLSLGLSFFSLFAFIIAAFSLLHYKNIIWITFLLIFIASSFLFLKGLKRGVYKKVPLKKNDVSSPYTKYLASPTEQPILWFFIGIILLIYLISSLGPAISWDGATYHLTIPKFYIENGGMCFISRNVYSNMPLGIEMLFMLALMLDGIVLAKLVHFSFGVLIIFGIYTFCARFFSKRQGVIASLLFLVSPVIGFEIKIEYIDLGLAFYCLISIYSFLLYRISKNKGLLLLMGIFSGSAMACKYTGAFLPFVIAICLICEGFIKKIRPKEVLISLVFLFGTSFLIFSPWLIKNIILVGNPLYPMFYNIFKGPEWCNEFSQKWEDFFYSLGMGRKLEDYLKLPYNMVVYGDMGHWRFDGTIEPLWLILIPALFFIPLQSTILYLLGYSSLFFIFWAATTQQMRFFIPAIPELAIISGYVIDSLGKKGKVFKNEVLFWTLVVFLFLTGIFIQSSNILSTLKDDIPVLVGTESKESYLTRTHQPYAMFQYVNKNLPGDAKILFVWENRGFYCKRRYLADSLFEVSWIMKMAKEAEDVLSLEKQLKEMGITHILINRGLQSIFMREEGMELIDRFIKERTKPIYSIYYIELYEMV